MLASAAGRFEVFCKGSIVKSRPLRAIFLPASHGILTADQYRAAAAGGALDVALSTDQRKLLTRPCTLLRPNPSYQT